MRGDPGDADGSEAGDDRSKTPPVEGRRGRNDHSVMTIKAEATDRVNSDREKNVKRSLFAGSHLSNQLAGLNVTPSSECALMEDWFAPIVDNADIFEGEHRPTDAPVASCEGSLSQRLSDEEYNAHRQWLLLWKIAKN